MRTWCWLAALVALLSLMLGCGAVTGRTGLDARATALQFTQALGKNDYAQACSLLAPGTQAQLEQATGKPCAASIADENIPTADALEDIATFGTMAQARFASDTVFLTRFPQGWKVLAAACSPVPNQPYDCQLQGG